MRSGKFPRGETKVLTDILHDPTFHLVPKSWDLAFRVGNPPYDRAELEVFSELPSAEFS